MKGCSSDTINPVPAEGSCPFSRHISPGSSPRRISAQWPIGLAVLFGKRSSPFPQWPGWRDSNPRPHGPEFLESYHGPPLCLTANPAETLVFARVCGLHPRQTIERKENSEKPIFRECVRKVLENPSAVIALSGAARPKEGRAALAVHGQVGASKNALAGRRMACVPRSTPSACEGLQGPVGTWKQQRTGTGAQPPGEAAEYKELLQNTP